jgi:hypothetical protein
MCSIKMLYTIPSVSAVIRAVLPAVALCHGVLAARLEAADNSVPATVAATTPADNGGIKPIGAASTSNKDLPLAAKGAGSPLVFDANDLVNKPNSGDTIEPVTFSSASNDTFLLYRSDAVGDYITLGVSVPAKQNYEVKVKFHRNAWRGSVQLAIDGVDVGTARDTYSADKDLWEQTIGTTSIAAGTRAFRFTIKEKHASSSSYQVAIDTITLIPTGP